MTSRTLIASAFATIAMCCLGACGAARRSDASAASDTRDEPFDADAAAVADVIDVSDITDVTDVADTSDVADAVECSAEVPFPAPTPSSHCSITSLPVDPAVACPGAMACPVSTLHSLRCATTSYFPWVSRVGSMGGSVLVAQDSAPVTVMFTISPGQPPLVDDIGAFERENVGLVADHDGLRTILGGASPNILGVRETGGGWLQSTVATSGTGGFLRLVDARIIDEHTASAAYHNLDDGSAYVASRIAGCWTSRVLPDVHTPRLAMDVDATGLAWVTWFDADASGANTLRLLSPSGATFTPLRWPYVPGGPSLGPSPSDRPRVLANGFDGTSVLPAMVIQLREGLHLIAPAAGATWTDRIVPGSALASTSGDCPAAGTCTPGPCATLQQGALDGFDVVRTASNHTYVAWTTIDAITDLFFRSPCTSPAWCCEQSVVRQRGTATVVIVRVDAAGTTEVLRVPFDAGGAASRGFAMGVRENTLLIVASVASGSDMDMRYFEVDTDALP